MVVPKVLLYGRYLGIRQRFQRVVLAHHRILIGVRVATWEIDESVKSCIQEPWPENELTCSR